MKKAERYAIAFEQLKGLFPDAQTELNYDTPFQLLVAVILSAQCTDKRVNLVTPELFKRFPTAKQMSESSEEEILRYIKSISYPNANTNSSVFALVVTGAWFLYFFLSNLAGTWSGPFVFDSSELPIITIYLMYLPILIQWMRKEKGQSLLRRFIMPMLALCGSVFMVIACIIGHGMACLWYLIVFAVVMVIGALVARNRKKSQ